MKAVKLKDVYGNPCVIDETELYFEWVMKPGWEVIGLAVPEIIELSRAFKIKSREEVATRENVNKAFDISL